MSLTKNMIAAAVSAGLSVSAASPANTLQPADVPQTSREITERLESLPAVVEAATNMEAKWWQKRSVWSAIVSVAATIASPYLVDYGIPADWLTDANREILIDVLVKGGGALSAYLAWRAGRPGVKPLGVK